MYSVITVTREKKYTHTLQRLKYLIRIIWCWVDAAARASGGAVVRDATEWLVSRHERVGGKEVLKPLQPLAHLHLPAHS